MRSFLPKTPMETEMEPARRCETVSVKSSVSTNSIPNSSRPMPSISAEQRLSEMRAVAQVENFVQQLADWAEKDRNALVCQLNSY